MNTTHNNIIKLHEPKYTKSIRQYIGLDCLFARHNKQYSGILVDVLVNSKMKVFLIAENPVSKKRMVFHESRIMQLNAIDDGLPI